MLLQGWPFHLLLLQRIAALFNGFLLLKAMSLKGALSIQPQDLHFRWAETGAVLNLCDIDQQPWRVVHKLRNVYIQHFWNVDVSFQNLKHNSENQCANSRNACYQGSKKMTHFVMVACQI